MKVDVLLGLQWGDEGKGKIVDVLTPDYDVIARFQGGPNAGHTLEFKGSKHILHTIPSGIFHPNRLNIVGNGLVIDPVIFRKEVERLNGLGTDVRSNLVISRRAHLILPTHRLLDSASETSKGDAKIGSTLKGIAPTYTDKIGREGLRVGDIEKPAFDAMYANLRKMHIQRLEQLKAVYDLEPLEKEWFESIRFLQTFKLDDTDYLINDLIGKNKRILAEGAQGSMLDIDFGSYPFVTSSNTTCAGACTGLGIAPSRIGKVIGIFKAYCTRVGSGPFPTELHDETGDLLRVQGHEFGSTTGRPRRCGWIDLVALKYAIMLNGVTELLMTKADVLTGFNHIKAALSYDINGMNTTRIPFDTNEKITPVYTELAGWKSDIGGLRKKSELPVDLAFYIAFIEEHTGVPVTYVSVGPDREAIIRVREVD